MTLLVNSFGDTRTDVFRGNADSPNYRNCFDDRIASKQNIFDLFDLPSRGLTASELVTEDKWWKGPEFLYSVEEKWPREDNAHSENENAMKEIVKNPETITHVLVSCEQVRQTGLHQILDANRYSSLTKLLRVTAYVLRFTRRPKKERGPEL